MRAVVSPPVPRPEKASVVEETPDVVAKALITPEVSEEGTCSKKTYSVKRRGG